MHSAAGHGPVNVRATLSVHVAPLPELWHAHRSFRSDTASDDSGVTAYSCDVTWTLLPDRIWFALLGPITP